MRMAVIDLCNGIVSEKDALRTMHRLLDAYANHNSVEMIYHGVSVAPEQVLFYPDTPVNGLKQEFVKGDQMYPLVDRVGTLLDESGSLSLDHVKGIQVSLHGNFDKEKVFNYWDRRGAVIYGIRRSLVIFDENKWLATYARKVLTVPYSVKKGSELRKSFFDFRRKTSEDNLTLLLREFKEFPSGVSVKRGTFI